MKNRPTFTPNTANGGGFEWRPVYVKPGIFTAEVRGKGAQKAFGQESGGHRWQRVPPTERRGRVQTSTITVAIFTDTEEKHAPLIDPRDVIETTYRGSGKGGQHRNKTDSAVRLQHGPSGITVRCENGRYQNQNRQKAWAELERRLMERSVNASRQQRAQARKAQVGSGQRGDKRRTIRVRDDSVVDHVTGQRWSYKHYQRGIWSQ